MALPAGLAMGCLTGWLWGRAGRIGRVGLAAGLGAVVLVGALAYVRPALLPGPAARFVSARERIGPPRVVSGEGALSKTRLAERPAWYQVRERGALLIVGFVVWSAYTAMSLHRCAQVRAAATTTDDSALAAEAKRCKDTWPDPG